MEEDAGKSIHDVYPENTALDFNRAGTPLLEIVTEPDLRSADEAYSYLAELRKLVRYLEICDGNMEEGSFRCDANVSVRKTGDDKLGTRVEIKNLNSIKNVKLAIEFEAKRLISLLDKGETVLQQTRSFDAATSTTVAIRDKEDAEDYRYFPDPDLTPFLITGEFIESVNKTIPVLQKERIKKYIAELKLSEYDATALTEEKDLSDFFESLVYTNLHQKKENDSAVNPKAAANWILGPVKSWLNEKNKSIKDFPVKAPGLIKLISLVEGNKLSFSAASSKILPLLIENPGADPLQLANNLSLIIDSNLDYITPIAEAVLLQFDDKVKEYRKGKKGLLTLFVGEVIKRSKGKADPKIVNEILLDKLKM
jgi:aspartyl-tRNA(Asn)/glutamyl-tRNA(Gln) amidotransferase subunit B